MGHPEAGLFPWPSLWALQGPCQQGLCDTQPDEPCWEAHLLLRVPMLCSLGSAGPEGLPLRLASSQ